MAAARLSSRLIWPLPALLAWGCAWVVFLLLQRTDLPSLASLLLACLLGVGFSVLGGTTMRRVIIGAGFPLSLAASGMAHVPAWSWLLPLGVLLLIYPLNAWRDAPVFPTPRNALRDLGKQAPLRDNALVLDAGLEWSWPLRAACALRCPWARVRQGDIWRADWSPYDMVYLFQRPESMARAAAKARADMRSGAWLVSLEFEVKSMTPKARLQSPDGRPVWVYQMA